MDDEPVPSLALRVPQPPPSKSPPRGPGAMAVHCPSCGALGNVTWDRLNHVLKCQRCGKHFAVSADGQTREMVKSAADRWVQRSEANGPPRHAIRRRLLIAVAAAVALPLLSVAGWRAVRPSASAQAEPDLPRELAPRAEAFTRAWLRGDVRTMKRLTTPAQDRVLYGWYSRHRPPMLPQAPDKVRVEVSEQATRDGQTTLRVRVEGLSPATGQSAPDLVQTWERRGETWYFLPPAK